jgi:uncharacterized membrane protein YedE/YeeE
MELIYKPWAWYVAGPIIVFVLFMLVKLGRNLGMSSNLNTMCTMAGAGKLTDHFKTDWRASSWGLILILGVFLGGVIAFNFLQVEAPQIHPDSVESLQNLGFTSVSQSFFPQEIYSLDALLTFKGFAVILLAGFLVGFGARYAGGCTSGHAISGLSNLQLPSLIAVIGFFIGGLVMVHVLIPLIF